MGVVLATLKRPMWLTKSKFYICVEIFHAMMANFFSITTTGRSVEHEMNERQEQSGPETGSLVPVHFGRSGLVQ